jgi:serine/threonine protein phosphatase PrpC
MLQNMIRDWLNSVAEDRASQMILDKTAILATDIGLRRSDNQDRVGAVRVQPLNSKIRAFICLAVSDGMGGMKNGAQCATLALAALFRSLIQGPDDDVAKRLLVATNDANDAVNKYAQGKGGATLSAVVIQDNGKAHYANVGDSRIYVVGNGQLISRVTVDDNMQEAFGGQGNELVQFIGIGPSMLPRIDTLPINIDSVFITSDGAHFIDPILLTQIVENAADPLRATERILALSRWLGGPDNATIAAFRLPHLVKHLQEHIASSVNIWSGTTQLQLAFAPRFDGPEIPKTITPPRETGKTYSVQKPERISQKRKEKKQSKLPEPKQLEIKIETDDSDAADS